MRRAFGSLAMMAAAIGFAAPTALASPLTPADPGHAAAGPSGSPGSFGIRLVDVPVSEAGDRRAWRYIIDYLHPGAVIHRRVAVDNMTSGVARVRVYADTATIKDGAFIGDPGQTPGELTAWTSVASPVLTLAPGASAMDMVTIRVPRDAWQGERYGVIWAQETSRVQQTTNLAVTEVSRVGVRIYLAVGPGGAPPTSFAITSVAVGRDPGGQPEVTARVRDTGERAVDLSGSLTLSGGPGGASSGPFPFQSRITLAPGQSGLMRAALSNATPAGTWHVTVTLQSGTTTRQARAVIQLIGMEATGMDLPGPALLGGGALVAILVLATWLITRRLGWRTGLRRT